MKKFSHILLVLAGFFSFNIANASIPNRDNPLTYLGPTARGSFTAPITNNTAISGAGEAGLRNFRLGGTAGWRINAAQRLKFSVEYLWQDITYSFFSRNSDQLMSQGAVGADYQYAFNLPFRPIVDINGYLSHAPSKTLGPRGGTINRFGAAQFFIDQRRIAGSNAGGIAPGLTIHPWWGSRAGVSVNYDDVRYDNSFGPNQDAKGFGGSFHISQYIANDVEVGARASIRQLFNNYAGHISWSNIPYFGSWKLSVFGDYTNGKNKLPDTFNLGLSADYFFGACLPTLSRDFKNEMLLPITVRDDFLEWTADPSVYMPQVLAVPDEKTTFVNPPPPVCDPAVPVFDGFINDIDIIPPNTFSVSIADAFHPTTGLTYVINVSPTPQAGNSVSITSTTGVITVVGQTPTQFTATVTATNTCGASVTSSPFTILIEQP